MQAILHRIDISVLEGASISQQGRALVTLYAVQVGLGGYSYYLFSMRTHSF
jgi:hypothetical protein